jgi:hypothetical protein
MEFILPEVQRKTPVECTSEDGLACGYGTWAEVCAVACPVCRECAVFLGTGLEPAEPVGTYQPTLF